MNINKIISQRGLGSRRVAFFFSPKRQITGSTSTSKCVCCSCLGTRTSPRPFLSSCDDCTHDTHVIERVTRQSMRRWTVCCYSAHHDIACFISSLLRYPFTAEIGERVTSKTQEHQRHRTEGRHKPTTTPPTHEETM